MLFDLSHTDTSSCRDYLRTASGISICLVLLAWLEFSVFVKIVWVWSPFSTVVPFLCVCLLELWCLESSCHITLSRRLKNCLRRLCLLLLSRLDPLSVLVRTLVFEEQSVTSAYWEYSGTASEALSGPFSLVGPFFCLLELWRLESKCDLLDQWWSSAAAHGQE